MRTVALAAIAVVVSATPALGAKRKPPPCGAGSFLVEEAASPLVPGGAAIPDQLVLGEDGSLAVASGCPATAAKQKPSKRGHKLSAKWTKKTALCSGLPKTATLKATFDAECSALAGTFKSEGLKRGASRSPTARARAGPTRS